MKDFTTPRTRTVIVCSVVLAILASILIVITDTVEPRFWLLPLLVCWLSFAAADLLAGDLDTGLWAGYLNFSYLLVWLALGALPALGIVVCGALTASVVRLAWRKMKPPQIIALALSRIAMYSLTLVTAQTLYSATGGTLPLQTFAATDLLPTALALGGAFITTQLVGWLLIRVGHYAPPTPLWKGDGSKQLLSELLILLLIPMMPVGLYQIGEGFIIVAALMAGIQAVRYRQVWDTRGQLIRRVQELSLLNNIGETLAANLEMDALLMAIYTQVQPLIHCTTFYVVLYDDHSEMLDFRLAMQRDQRIYWQPRRLSNYLTDAVIKQREALLIYASDKALLKQIEAPEIEYPPVYVGVPLMVGDKVIGVLAAWHDENEKALGLSDVRILETVAHQAALAIRNAILFDRSREMANNLAQINASVQHVMFNLDSAHGLATACQTAMQITNAQRAAIYQLDLNNKKIFRRAQGLNLTDEFNTQYETMQYRPELYQNGPRVMIEPDAATAEFARVGGFRSFVEIPLRSSSTIIGYLAVYHDETHYYRKTELDMLETLAYQITAAIDNASLLQALEQYASEQAQLVHLSRTTSASLSLPEVIQNVHRTLSDMIEVDYLQVGVVVRGRLQLLTPEGKPTLTVPMPPELGDLEQRLHSATPMVFFHTDRSASQPIPSPLLMGIMSQRSLPTLAVTPMVVNHTLIGAVLTGGREKFYFSDNELRLIEMAVNQVAGQIYNAEQFTVSEQDRRQRLAQLSLLETLAQQISSVLDLNELIANVLQAAITATQADMAGLALLIESEDFWVISRERNSDGEWQLLYDRMSRDKGVTGRVAKNGTPTLVADNRRDADYEVNPSGASYLSSLAVPMTKEGSVVGVLYVESLQTDFFNEEQAGFLNNLAGHAVISIDNARLLEERERQIEMLTRLRQLSLDLANALNLSTVAWSIAEAAFEIIGAQDVAVFQHEAGDLLLLCGKRYDARGKRELPETLIRGRLAQEALQYGEMQVIDDLRQYDPYAYVDTRDYVSLLAIPLKRQHGVRVILCFGFTAPYHLGSRDQNALDLLTIQAEGHIENAALNESILTGSNRMRAILDSARDGVLMLSRFGALVEYNPSAEKLLGLSLEAYVEKRLWDVLVEHAQSGEASAQGGYSETEVAELARILEHEPDRIFRRSFARVVNGQTTYIEEIGSPVVDSHNQITGRLLVLRDVTEEKQLEAYRDEITNMIVHDLRSPLGSIISALTLALESIGDPEDSIMVEPTLDVSLISAKKLLRLVDSLLDIAKLQNRKMPIKYAPQVVARMVTEAYLTLSNSIQQSEVRVEINIPRDLPPVWADGEKIQRVLVNLLDNAIRYTPKGSRVMITAKALPHRRRVQISVADSGMGIPLEERDRIFEKFTQIKGNMPNFGSKGSGLGLTFCKLTLEAHGERIWVDSESPLPGACFSFTLSYVPENAPDDTQETPRVNSPQKQMNGNG